MNILKRNIILLLAACFFFCAFLASDQYHIEYPETWPEPNLDIDKYIMTDAGVELGKRLFYDPILSRDNMISCSSCHSPFMAFAHTDHKLSHGIGDSIGTRNAPPLFNLAWHTSFNWDGAVHHIEVQAINPISNPREMGSNLKETVERISNDSTYIIDFSKAFGSREITGALVLKALAQFQLSLISSQSKYDLVKSGLDTFTVREKRGYELFLKHCNSCHLEPLFTNFEFINNGLLPDTFLNDKGRFEISTDSSDLYTFKVPSLRNIELTKPYMHDGRFRSLRSVLQYYSLMDRNEFPNMDSRVKDKFVFSNSERIALEEFLKTLTDRTFVKNKNHRPNPAKY